MKKLYEKGTANYPRLATDRFFVDYKTKTEYRGYIERAFDFVEEEQLLREDLWERFVYQFRSAADNDGGWRGEYWGKMMRGACFVYSHTQNPRLYALLSRTVDEMIASADEMGRISTFAVEREFRGWDIWSRKYVMLGMQYFLEICEDEAQKERIIASMRGQADYLISKLGDKKEGKLPIFKATSNWRGLNSCSVLEPMVRLYNLTGEEAYLNFAAYIVKIGGTEISNLFKLAYENDFAPYQYPVIKAYEMISCFEGLLEYYRVVGNEDHKVALINFADRILETDFTVIGSCGCEHELFDHSTVRQADPDIHPLMQETCVTVTLMKFMYQMHLLTGDVKYADAFEVSLYNAYLGAFNTEHVIEPSLLVKHPDWAIEALPFDSYTPLTVGTRGRQIGGQQLMSDMHYYGCCACIGSAGIGLVHKMQLLSTADGFAYNLFLEGTVTSVTPAGQSVRLVTETEYPKNGYVRITVDVEREEEFTILLRNPAWSRTTGVTVNSKLMATGIGYTDLTRIWKKGDVIEMMLDMRTEAIRPILCPTDLLMININWGADVCMPYRYRQSPKTKNHVSLRRGPITLAQESRLGYDPTEAVDILVGKDGYVDTHLAVNPKAPYDSLVEVEVPLTDGSYMTVTDCASAGKLWTDESKLAIWMLTV